MSFVAVLSLQHPDVWFSAVDVRAHGVSGLLATGACRKRQWFPAVYFPLLIANVLLL